MPTNIKYKENFEAILLNNMNSVINLGIQMLYDIKALFKKTSEKMLATLILLKHKLRFTTVQVTL